MATDAERLRLLKLKKRRLELQAAPVQAQPASEPVAQPRRPVSQVERMTRGAEAQLIGTGRGLTDIAESATQLGMDITGDPRADEFTRRAAEERRFFEKTTVGRSIPGQVGRFAGQVAPSLAIPGAAATFAGRTAAGAGLGAGLGFGGFREEATPEARFAERGTQAAIGGTVGALVPAGVATAQAIRRPIATGAAVLSRGRVLSKEFRDTGKLLKEFGMDGTIGGKSASEFMIGMEAKLRGGTHESIKQGINTANKSIVTAFQSFKSKVGTRQFHQVGKRVFSAADRAVNKLNGTRVAEFGSEMTRLERLGGGKFIGVKNLEEYLSGGQAGRLGAKRFQELVKSELDDLAEATGGSGFISATQLQDNLMKPLSAASVGKTKIWPKLDTNENKRMASEMLRALRKDIDGAIASGEGSAAAQILKRARDRYSSNSKPIDEIKNSVLGTILNEPGVTAKGIGQVSMEAIGKKLNKMSPDQVSRTMHLLKRYDKGAANDLIALRIDNAIGKAGKAEAGAAFNLSHLDVNKLVDELGGKASLRALMGSQFAKFERAIKAAKIIAPVRTGAGREAIGSAAQVGGTLVSANPTFAAINAARVLGPIGLRKALLDSQGQRAIIKIANQIGKPARFQKELTASIEALRQFGEE